MIRIMINGLLYEVDEKHLKPVEQLEPIDAEYTEIPLEGDINGKN